MLHTWIAFIVIGVFMSGCSHKAGLPDYVATDNPILQNPTRPFTFPLTEDDNQDLATLQAKFDAEKNCAGLAAPQLGIGKAAIIFAAPEDPELKKFRKNFVQTMPRTLWLNPKYKAVGNEMTDDWESCFSIPGQAYLVPRHATITYEAYDINGILQTGQATGFLARIIQHETDHTMGILCKKKAKTIMGIDEYRAMRRKAMGQ